MEYTDLSELNFGGYNPIEQGVDLRWVKFFSKDFSNYDLSNGVFSYSVFTGANFTNATITNTNFGYSKMGDVTWTDGTTIFSSNKVCDDTSVGACN